MVPAMEERDSLRRGRRPRHSDPIADIVVKYDTSADTELITAMSRACATSQFDNTIWSTFHGQVKGLAPSFTPSDAAIVMKFLILHTSRTDKSIDWGPAVRLLFSRILKSSSGTSLGTYSCLYLLQSVSVFPVPTRVRSQVFPLCHSTLSNRVSSLPLPLVTALVQASESAPSELCALLVNAAIERIDGSVDPDGMFGLVSSVGRLKNLSPEIFASFLNACKPVLLNEYIEGFTLDQLAGTANVFSRQGPAVESGHLEVFTKLAAELCACGVPEWTPRSYAVVLNAFGTAGVFHGDLMEKLQIRVDTLVGHELCPRQSAMASRGLMRLGVDVCEMFPTTYNQTKNLIDAMDLHSASKSFVGFLDNRDSELIPFCANRITHLLEPSGSCSDSIIVILSALSKLPCSSVDPMLEELVRALSLAITLSPKHIPLISQILVDGIDKPVFHLLAAQTAKSVLIQPLSLVDLSKLVYAWGSCGTESVDMGQMTTLVRNRISELPLLSFRQLSRLGSGLAKCGVFDEDILGAVSEWVAKKRRR
jgi:hypothetical protein